MTRTSIITANGDRFHREGRAKRIIIRLLMGVGVIFLSAAVIGMGKAIITPAAHNPTSQEFTILHNAEKAGGKNCRLEWNEVQESHEVICDPAKGAPTYNDALRDIRNLAARKAISHTNSDGSVITDPAGIALVQECLSDTTLSMTELHACLTQPAN